VKPTIEALKKRQKRHGHFRRLIPQLRACSKEDPVWISRTICHTKSRSMRQAAVHAFRGDSSPRSRCCGVWEAHAAPRWTAAATATAETCSRDLNLSTRMTSARRCIARFAAPAERSFLERRGAAELQIRRSALMTRAQRLAGEHCGRRTTGTSSTSLGSCPASDFVELLGATRAETSGLARCHGAADELQNGRVQKTGFKGDIRENHG